MLISFQRLIDGNICRRQSNVKNEDHGTNDRKWLGLVGYVYSLVGSRVGHTDRS